MPRIPLPPITDFEAYNKNTKAQYEALGQFVVAFEAMVGETRDCSINLLDQARLVDIAFHHPSMTAKPLFDIFRALVVESLELEGLSVSPRDKDIFRGVLKNIASEFFYLVDARNTLLHGTWQIGYSSSENPNAENFFLYKYKPTKDGLQQEDVPKHAFELLKLKDRCEGVRAWISSIHFCIPRLDRPHESVGDRFHLQDSQWHLTHGAEPETLPRKSE